MPVIIVGNEKNFAALRPRIFSGRVSNATVGEVSDAIAAANPHADLKALQPGTILTVPDSPHVSVRGDVSIDEATKETLAGIAEQGASALEQLVAVSRGLEREATAERKRLIAALSAKELDAAARKDKALASDLKDVQQAMKDEEAAAKQRQTGLQDASKSWNAELDALKGLLA
jgi:hypothetical protein